jgi:hypothetical protein
MDKQGSNCQELIEKTASSIDDDVLQLLFVSVQQTNLKMCIQYAIQTYWRLSMCLLQLGGAGE